MAQPGSAPPTKPIQTRRPFAPTGWIHEALTFFGEATLLLIDFFRRLFTKPREIGELFGQMSFVGVNSVPVVALTTFSSGAVIDLYTSEILVRYGASSLAGGAVGLTITREMAPVLAGIMVAARCGSAMAAQIGTMAVTEQIDALRSLNVHPTNYLVIPRILACLAMLPILAVVGMYSGILGGYIVSVYLANVPSGTFMNSIQQFVEPKDIYGGIIKATVFGFIVALVACQQGLQTTRGAEGVGKTTTKTVVISMVLIYVADFFLTQILFT